MNSWRLSYENTLKELELSKKKKKALDDLLSKGRMSLPTYEHLAKELSENASNLEINLRTLHNRILSRSEELKTQTHLLQSYLAMLEISKISDEIDKDKYAKDKRIFVLGLESIQAETNQLTKALGDIFP